MKTHAIIDKNNPLLKPLFASLSTLLLLSSACSTAPSSQHLSPSKINEPEQRVGTPQKESCHQFCETIDRCSSQVGHKKLARLMCEIAKCETGGKCLNEIRSKTGRYKGPFQFSGATWRTQCEPIFIQKGKMECLKTGKIYDSCCSSVCASEIVSQGGIRNWPSCGKRAKKRLS